MKSIKVTLDVTPAFKQAALAGNAPVFGRLLDGCGADNPSDVPGKDQIEFEMWEDGFSSLEHWLKEQFPNDVLNITRMP